MYSQGPCLIREVGLDYLQCSLPISTICDSVTGENEAFFLQWASFLGTVVAWSHALEFAGPYEAYLFPS